MATAPKITINAQVIEEWTDQTIEQLNGGWSYSDIRRGLTQSGCTPKLIDKILKSANQKITSSRRREGRKLMKTGAGLILLALGIALMQKLMIPDMKYSTIAPLFGIPGVLALLRGLFKSIIGN